MKNRALFLASTLPAIRVNTFNNRLYEFLSRIKPIVEQPILSHFPTEESILSSFLTNPLGTLDSILDQCENVSVKRLIKESENGRINEYTIERAQMQGLQNFKKANKDVKWVFDMDFGDEFEVGPEATKPKKPEKRILTKEERKERSENSALSILAMLEKNRKRQQNKEVS